MVSLLFDQSGRRRYCTIDERNAFLKVAKKEETEEAYALLSLLAFTGCRVSEALALTPTSVDHGAEAVVIETLKRRKAGVFRAVPLPSGCLTLLSGLSAKPKLWSYSRSTAWRIVKRNMARAGVQGPMACPKGLRHSYAIANLQLGVPVTQVQEWLGHANITTTQLYAQALGPEERALAAKFWQSFELETE